MRARQTLLMFGILALAAVTSLGQAKRASGRGEHAQSTSLQAVGSQQVEGNDLVKVGFHNLGGGGFNGDVWGQGNFVYVGTFGVAEEGLCLGTGVKVVDISNPAAPVMVTTLSVPDGSHPSDVKVASISTGSFQGDLLVNSNEACAFGGFSGVQLWDVRDPRNPSELGRFATAGVHNAYLYQKNDRAYTLLAVQFAEVFGPPAGLPGSDLQIVDVTDPTNPVLVGEWTIGRDAGLAFGSPGLEGIPDLPPGSDCTPPPETPPLCRGQAIAGVYLHDVWASQDGDVAYLAYWDAGLITLDISDPANPTLLGVATEPLSDEGNAHVAVADELGTLILVGDEDFEPGPWGFLRVFDGSDLTNPVQLATFATDNALAASPPDDGFYTMHNAVIEGSTAYISWYSDGVRVVDLSEPSVPTEVASFVPPDVPDPNGYFPPKALVWGVFVQDELIFASDINSGLYVLAFDRDGDGCADIEELPCLGPTVGDVDCNSDVNSIDAALVLQFDAGLIATLPCLPAGDVNGDSEINSIDAALILQFTAGLLSSLPP